MSEDNDDQGDKNFKIPKIKSDETVNFDLSNSSDLSDFTYNAGQSIAANSYYEYYNQYTEAQWQQSTAYPQQYYTPLGASAITQNICNTLSSIKEKPKNHQKNIFKDTVPDIGDITLPKELTSLFQPLFCKLCTAQLSSNVMAKLHYKSKNHDKKVRNFLIAHAKKTGTPLHKRAKLDTKFDEELNPKWFHCDVCDLPLTGKMHAESHYMGKNHQRVVMGYRIPAGEGYYNAEGKWVRSAASKKSILKDGEDTFGQDFKKKEDSATRTPTAVIPEPKPVIDNPFKFLCSLCNVKTNCQEQLDIHFQGQKHKKKLTKMGVIGEHVGNTTPKNEDGRSVKDIDLSSYRTPSGNYYCPTCNITLGKDLQFKLHIKGKQHIKKSNNSHVKQS